MKIHRLVQQSSAQSTEHFQEPQQQSQTPSPLALPSCNTQAPQSQAPVISFLPTMPFPVQPASLCKNLTACPGSVTLTTNFPVLSARLRGSSHSSSSCNCTAHLTHTGGPLSAQTDSCCPEWAPEGLVPEAPQAWDTHRVALEIRDAVPPPRPHRESCISGLSHDYH